MAKIGKIILIVVLILVLLFIGLLLFAIAIFGNWNKLTNEEALELVKQPSFSHIEKYLSDSNLIYYIHDHGDPIYRHQNIWWVNDLIVDYDTSMLVINPDSHYYFQNAKRADSSTTRYISFNNNSALDTLFEENFNFDSLKSILEKMKDLKVIAISTYDSGDFVEFRLQNNSPISSGFGILSTRRSIEKHIYDELIKIDSTHYRFLEYVQ